MEPFSPPRKKHLIFSQKKAVLIFQETETETPKKSFIFQETELSHISGKEYSEHWHNGTFLLLQERNILNTGSGIRKLSYILGNEYSEA